MKVGKIYMVSCLVRKADYFSPEFEEQENWLDLTNEPKITIIKQYVPVIDFPHNDIENGQKEIHYHEDDRFLDYNNPKYKRIFDRRPQAKNYSKIEYLPLECKTDKIKTITPTNFILKSTLKHTCIYKGKCPHRGMDLSNELPSLNESTMEWEIECPLHGLRFNYNTKELIKHERT